MCVHSRWRWGSWFETLRGVSEEPGRGHQGWMLPVWPAILLLLHPPVLQLFQPVLLCVHCCRVSCFCKTLYWICCKECYLRKPNKLFWLTSPHDNWAPLGKIVLIIIIWLTLVKGHMSPGCSFWAWWHVMYSHKVSSPQVVGKLPCCDVAQLSRVQLPVCTT